MANHKIVLFGIGGTGKSSVLIQFVSNTFIVEYDPTIEDSFRKNLVVDEEPVLLDILDTAGQEEYSSMRDQYTKVGDGFLLVYDITNRASFSEITRYYDQILRDKNKTQVPMVVIGNKSDLQSREVTIQEGSELAKTFKAPFFETSAKTRINIEESFKELVREIRRIRKEQEDKRQKEAALKKKKGCLII